MVDFALINAFFSGEVIGLPLLASLGEGRALHQDSIPLGTIGADRLLAGSGHIVKEGLFSSAGTTVILFDVGMVDFALGDALLSCKVIGLPN